MNATTELEKEIGPDRVLVVNMALEATQIVHWGDAVTLLWNKQATTLISRSDGKKLRSPSIQFDWPVVIMLNKYVPVYRRVYQLKDVTNKSRVRQRDNYTCGYCGNFGNTIDHIIPRSRGGMNVWGNLITSCYSCNGNKRDRTPEEAGMIRPVITPGYNKNSRLAKAQTYLHSVLSEMLEES